MAILKCKMCGGDLTIEEGVSVCECEYCGTKQTAPIADDEKKLNLFNRATRLRINGEFDKAAALYESLVAEFPEEAEAYWGLVICHYGIEYVDDPATGKKIPTCHRASFDPISGNDNFRMAMEYADVLAQKVYRDEAREIDRIREEILSVCKDEKPYDIFICYKETDAQGERTIDSVIAQDVYDALTDKGYRVFFARISLEDKLGSQYEPFIFSALNSARIMLAFGTKYEYFHAVWVKNEWSRFLKLMAKDKSKVLIPCYKDMDAYDMPDEFHALQAQDMGKIGAIQDLLRGIEKILGANKTVVKETVVVNGNAQVAPLLKRTFMFLEDGDWESADEYCEKVLDLDPECGEAYLGKLMAELQVKTREGLKNQRQPFDSRNNYKKAISFGDEKLKAELQGYIAAITESNLTHSYNVAMQAMRSATDEYDYEKAADQFADLTGYKDSKAKEKECLEKAEKCRELEEIAYKDAILSTGKEKIDNEQYDEAIQAFESIPGWKDADEQLEICRKKKAEEEAADEEQRLKAEQEAQVKAKRKKRRTIITLVSIVLAGLIGYFGVYPFVACQQGNYKVYIDMYHVKEFTIPEGVTEIKDSAFDCCSSLTSVTIPDSVTSIGFRAFAYCDNLTSITIPGSVTSIDDRTFEGCDSLDSVYITDLAAWCAIEFDDLSANPMENADNVYVNGELVTDLVIPEGVTSIGDYALFDCDSLTSVTIPDGVTAIGEGAFYHCDSLTSITIPGSVTSIDDRTFEACDSLDSVYITDLAAWCAIEFDSFDANPMYHADNLYMNGELVTAVVIPDSVTTIGECAFAFWNSLTSVTIPDSVTTIGEHAFYNCDSLKDVYFAGTKSEWKALDVEFLYGRSVMVHCSDGIY